MCLDPQQSVVYQLRIVLIGISPLIWRRLLISGGTHLAYLHDILQILFSWSGEQSSRFRIHGRDFETAELGEAGVDRDRHSVRLSDFHLHCREKFFYECDFTAGWRLEIRPEETLPRERRSHSTRTFSPLAERLPGPTTPELLFLETNWAALVSYGLTVKLLEDVLQMDESLTAFTVRQQVFKAAGSILD